MWIGMSGGMTQHYAKDLKRKKKHTSKEYGWTKSIYNILATPIKEFFVFFWFVLYEY